MAWTTPKTWVLDEIVDETDLNTHVRDNLRTLYPDYGTTLPVSPYDAKQAILVDSTTAPTYHWHMRYNASNSTSYKWEFIGGTDLITAAVDIGFTNQTSYGAEGNILTVPLAGVYDVIILGASQVSNGNISYVSYGISGSTGAADTKASRSTGDAGALYFVWRETLAAAATIQIYARASNSSTSHSLLSSQVAVRPVRLA